ncbi:peptidoglycan editing factor PgeF [Benzoatithermus flavus]|uniref:Purine nucleoside phosphorylase n=1 Tax=Benzoatithermus flavus TaxID=3108223 RepID=A0ABU8XQJ9_9PROT
MMLRSSTLVALPGVRHAFFTRRGGVSEGVWASLNVGLRSGDDPWRVARNRTLAAEALGVPAERLVTARQVHGTVALKVCRPWDNAAAPEADALVTDRPGLLLGVLTADCGPLLLADPEAEVVGAAHAGWKGALAGVVEATVAAMIELGADPARITAALGPCIGRTSYEVGPEFVARFAETDAASATFFTPAPGRVKALFDLKGYIGARLRRAGVERIELLPHDTCAEEDLFFSFRRTTQRGEERFGLQLSAIVLEG